MMLQLKMNYKRVNTYFFVRDTTINYHEQQADTGKQTRKQPDKKFIVVLTIVL